MSVTQEGTLADFRQIRVRFEVPDRIAALYIKERSYEVDLATTPETEHLPLFGISAQVRQLTDVTLDFQNYINRKVEAEGVYTFDLKVTDRKGRTATAALKVRALVPEADEEESSADAVSIESFRFERIGSSAVSGADRFGISWRTIDSNEVVIQLFAEEDGSIRLAEIVPADYDEVSTRTQLEQTANGSPSAESLLLPAAGGKAAGSVFAVIRQGEPYLFRITESESSLSPGGTSVVLIGEYKH
jgi:hypothetical protein